MNTCESCGKRSRGDWCKMCRPCTVCSSIPAPHRSQIPDKDGYWCYTCFNRFRQYGAFELPHCLSCESRIKPSSSPEGLCIKCRVCACCGGTVADSKSHDERWPGAWCGKCVKRWKKYGDPFETRGGPEWSLERRFFVRVSKEPTPEGCLLWLGPPLTGGYGILQDDQGTARGAHVVALMLATGERPNGRYALHARNCPNRLCVNPEHLRWGSAQENSIDAMAVRYGITLTDEEVRVIAEWRNNTKR